MSIKGGSSARRRRAVLGTFVTTVVIGLTAGVAGAAPGSGSPSDERAEYNTGNIQPGTCPVGTVEVTSSVTENIVGGTTLNITAVDAGVTVTHIFVKGGPDYNLYEPGERGLPADPPWTNLISPFNNGDNIPAISHWFACGTSTGDTTPTTVPEDTTPTTVPEDTTPTTEPEDTTPTTVPEDTSPTTVPEDTTATTEPGDTTATTEPGDTSATTDGGSSTTAGATTTTDKLPTTGSSNVGAVVAIALLAIGAGGAAVIIARRKLHPAD